MEGKQFGNAVERDDLGDRSLAWFGVAVETLPPELQDSALVTDGLDPVGHLRIAMRDDDPDLPVGVDLRLGVVERGLVACVVERDIPEAAELEAR